jgi:hypothetical protein
MAGGLAWSKKLAGLTGMVCVLGFSTAWLGLTTGVLPVAVSGWAVAVVGWLYSIR